MSPAITAAGVANTRPPSGTTPMIWSMSTSGLESLRIVFHAIVRIR